MFPLNSNTPYVKDTGERARLGQIIGGSDTPELPDYGIADAGKVLTVGEDGSLEWDTSGSGGGDSFLSYDFTKAGTRTNVHGVNFSSDGANIASRTAYIPLSIGMTNITLYIDVDTLTITSDSNSRFIMGSSESGLVYRGTDSLWGFYAQAWEMSEISDATIFDGSTVKVYIDSDGKWHIYVNGELIFEPTGTISNYNLMIGSSGGNSIKGLITGVRVYNGNYTE